MILGRSKKRIAPTRNSLDVSYLEGEVLGHLLVLSLVYKFTIFEGWRALLIYWCF